MQLSMVSLTVFFRERVLSPTQKFRVYPHGNNKALTSDKSIFSFSITVVTIFEVNRSTFYTKFCQVYVGVTVNCKTSN